MDTLQYLEGFGQRQLSLPWLYSCVFMLLLNSKSLSKGVHRCGGWEFELGCTSVFAFASCLEQVIERLLAYCFLTCKERAGSMFLEFRCCRLAFEVKYQTPGGGSGCFKLAQRKDCFFFFFPIVATAAIFPLKSHSPPFLPSQAPPPPRSPLSWKSRTPHWLISPPAVLLAGHVTTHARPRRRGRRGACRDGAPSSLIRKWRAEPPAKSRRLSRLSCCRRRQWRDPDLAGLRWACVRAGGGADEEQEAVATRAWAAGPGGGAGRRRPVAWGGPPRSGRGCGRRVRGAEPGPVVPRDRLLPRGERVFQLSGAWGCGPPGETLNTVTTSWEHCLLGLRSMEQTFGLERGEVRSPSSLCLFPAPDFT